MKTIRLKDLHIPSEVLQPLKTNTPLDKFISTRGGILPSTVYIVVGAAGTGKTAWGIDTLSKLKKANSSKKFLYISGEQDEIDNFELSQYIPSLSELDTLYLSGSKNPQPLLESTLKEGWDVVLVDSLEAITGRVAMTSSLNQKESLRWFMDLMFKNKRGKNDRNIYTTFLTIQQATKTGVYKGDSSIEFDTTGMLYIKRGNDNTRTLMFSKNRRGESKKNMEFELKNGEMSYEKPKPIVSEKSIKKNSPQKGMGDMIQETIGKSLVSFLIKEVTKKTKKR
tara:strand:- start:1692 stop:2534 length:843 start_codon:yes stop_codon:yes gene_type:complete